jgi:DNA (cytosine-5)-methyltransferase 1
MQAPTYLMIDLFCGAGGTTTGAEASGVCKVIAAVNHDQLAIASHASNHEGAQHFTEDIRNLNTSELVAIADTWRKRYPRAELILWASLECTNFSKAKGGLPRDADSRTLAEHLPRYIRALNPDKVMIENVEEFLAWGPLDDHGKPLSRKNGRDYLRWVKSITALGYTWDWRILNSADYGAYTSRRRLFGVFHREQVAVWPAPTHLRRAQSGNLFEDNAKPWRAVADVLDLADLGRSIFERRTPLVDNTLRRILRGLRKYINKPMMMTCNSPGYCTDLDVPASTVTTKGHKALVVPMVATTYNPGQIRSAGEPANTMNTAPNLHLVSAVQPILQHYYGNGECSSIESPAPTITTKDRMALVYPMLQTYFTPGSHRSGNDPAQSITGQDRIQMVTPEYLDRDFISGADSSLMDPAGSITTVPKMNLATAFLVNPQYHNAGNAINQPAPTIIASQGSRPLSLAVATAGEGIQDQQGDSQAMLELKAFMCEHGIADIYLRMLKVQELKRIQGFPENYILRGTQEDQKKFIGNAVVPQVVSAWLSAWAQNKQYEKPNNYHLPQQ